MLPKMAVWAQISESLRLHNRFFVDKSEPKKHTSGRREDKMPLRDSRYGSYLLTKRGYLVRAK